MAELLTTQEVSRLAGVTVATVNRWAITGRLLPAYKAPGIRGVNLYAPADVQRLIDKAA